MDLVVTNGCNLRCRYCYHFGSAGEVPGDLPLADWLRFFDDLERCSVLEVSVTGGEPFHRPDLADLLQDLTRRPLRTLLFSNATLIGSEQAAFLAGLSRFQGVKVSLDGASPASHDACRGTGSFQKAVEGIRHLQAHGVRVQLQVTLHRLNVEDLEKTAVFVLEELGLPSFHLNSAYDMGLCSRNRQALCLTLEERVAAMTTLEDLERRYPRRIRATAGPLSQLRRWTAMEAARRKGEAWPQGGHLAACGGVFRKLAVRADGALVPCNQLSDRVLGWIQHDDLQAVWQRHPELVRLRGRQELRLSQFSQCRDCPWVSWCTGGCPAGLPPGEADRPGTEDCLRAYLDQGGRLPLEPVVH